MDRRTGAVNCDKRQQRRSIRGPLDLANFTRQQALLRVEYNF